MVAHNGVLVVPVVEDTVRMRCVHIEERIVGSRLVGRGVPVHLGVRMGAGGLVVHDIDNHCDSALMARVDEFLVSGRRTVGLVEGKV